MINKNMNLIEEIFSCGFKQFFKNTFLLGWLGCSLNPLLAEHFPYFSGLLLFCILPWKPKTRFYIAMETNQCKYIYILFIDKVVQRPKHMPAWTEHDTQ